MTATTPATTNGQIPEWLTKSEAATMLSTSERSLERKATRGEIETRKQRRPGKSPAVLYRTTDVLRLSQSNTFQMPAAAPPPPTQLAAAPPAPPRDPTDSLIAALAGTISQQLRDTAGIVTPAKRTWLTLDEAQNESGLSKRFLKRLCIGGKITAVWDEQKWKIAAAALAEWQPEGKQSPPRPGSPSPSKST
jgi:hypothetical protein